MTAITLISEALAVNRLRFYEFGLRYASLVSLILVLAAVALLIGGIGYGALPAFQKFGFRFLVTAHWSEATEIFGGFGPIYGTVVTSLIATVIASVFGIAVGVFITEWCPRSLRSLVSITIELLAGIPSIIYGVWGFYVVVPWVKERAAPFLEHFFAHVPVLSVFFGAPKDGAIVGTNILSASLILSIMIVPFVAARSRDMFEAVPEELKHAVLGLGGTTWEVVWHVVLPYTRAGVFGGVMLALGRALGETMAIAFVVGNVLNRIDPSILAPGTTISSTIADQFLGTYDDLAKSSLLAIAFILFVITAIVRGGSNYLLSRMEQKNGGHS